MSSAALKDYIYSCKAYAVVLGILSAILTLEIVGTLVFACLWPGTSFRIGFCALRVYALSDQSILIAALVFVYGGWSPLVYDLVSKMTDPMPYGKLTADDYRR